MVLNTAHKPWTPVCIVRAHFSILSSIAVSPATFLKCPPRYFTGISCFPTYSPVITSSFIFPSLKWHFSPLGLHVRNLRVDHLSYLLLCHSIWYPSSPAPSLTSSPIEMSRIVPLFSFSTITYLIQVAYLLLELSTSFCLPSPILIHSLHSN